jgi:hypothetical protein
MKKILLNKRFYSVAESWNELTEKQLLQVMRILFLPPVKGELKAEEKLLRLTQTIIGLSNYRFFQCNVEELEEFFYLTSFLFAKDLVFTKNILPLYKYSHTAFYGPADHLDNLRMKEFTLTEDLYMRWYDSEQRDTQALNELVAILYRPAPAHYDFVRNPNGDCRERFNQNVSSFYASNYINLWPPEVKIAIAYWYNGCRIEMVNRNPEVFSGSGDPALYGLVSVMLNVAESKVFGDFDKVEEQYVNLVMMQLNEAIDKGKKLEAMYKSK